MCLPFEPIPPPNEKCQKLVDILKTLLWIQLVMGLLKFIIGDGSHAMTDLICCLILYQGYSQLNCCNMIIYIFFNFTNATWLLNIIGRNIQNGSSFFPQAQYAPWLIEYASFVFYIIAFYYGFESYKEFKACMIELGGPMMGGGMVMGGSAYVPPNRYQTAGQSSSGKPTVKEYNCSRN